MDDARGISRGRCRKCPQCGRYTPPAGNGLKCAVCGCPPAVHMKYDQATQPQVWDGDPSIATGGQLPSYSSDSTTEWNPPTHTVPLTVRASVCSVPGCNQVVDFDINSGQEYKYCSGHRQSQHVYVQDIEMSPIPDGFYGADGTAAMYQDQSQAMPMLQAQPLPKDNSMCIIPECQKPKYVDSSTGVTHEYCGRTHAAEGKNRGILPHHQDPGLMDTTDTSAMATPCQQPAMIPPPAPGSVQHPSGLPKCAITECPNPCYVDDSGTVHECCGITHAMEHQRRQALWQQVNQQVVKGVTHCLLPGCNRHTWPFENYCGKTHAILGQQQGLVPPPSSTGSSPASTGPKDSSICIIPECQKPKFVDTSSGLTRDYCGKTHAAEGKKRGIRATADKVEEQCDLPGCTNRKRTEGTAVYDYCCQDHAKQDAPNRDARILTSDSEVQKFLKKFSNLKVVSMTENPHAKPGGTLFNTFQKAYMSLPKAQQTTCLAFHGTSESNISSICQNGYDSKKRSGQAYGAGEYFAKSPTIPLGYCKGGKKMLLNELLLGQSGTHHTQHGDIVVMKKPAHDLPRYVITFQ